ncbi:uncharacterized protein LOC135824248 [Sycon ciliatum]|uniref:uncharacterized protein LOC135824248 n=1 Tax=Sycon ciliatum TaxID=27933 RepID=UPI0031F690E6
MRRSDSELHFKYVRMSPSVFDKLLSKIKPHLRKRSRRAARSRPEMSDTCKLVVTLKYLASGQSMQELAIAFRMGHSIVHYVVVEVCNAIWSGLMEEYLKCPSTPAEWHAVSRDFVRYWHFPHCLGAIDGKHVVIQAPNNSGSEFFNYKNSNSIVLLAVADAKYRFLAVDIGESGRHSDGGVLSNSVFGKALENASLGVPAPDQSVPELGEFPYCLVGDEAFPLRG